MNWQWHVMVRACGEGFCGAVTEGPSEEVMGWDLNEKKPGVQRWQKQTSLYAWVCTTLLNEQQPIIKQYVNCASKNIPGYLDVTSHHISLAIMGDFYFFLFAYLYFIYPFIINICYHCYSSLIQKKMYSGLFYGAGNTATTREKSLTVWHFSLAEGWQRRNL